MILNFTCSENGSKKPMPDTCRIQCLGWILSRLPSDVFKKGVTYSLAVQSGNLESSVRKLGWTEEQMRVICADPGARILVDAGPGTGKTAVACARIAWLIEDGGLSPEEIWLVSFTRTAVHELRNRIGTYLTDRSRVSSIRITTIDSFAWKIHSGFDETAALLDGYQDNIEKAKEMIRNDEGVREFLSRIKYLLIDEAQDIIGTRVELILEFINALSEVAGVTVLSDEAQAIYGFSENEENYERNENIKRTLPENIRKYMNGYFSELELLEIHRTSDETLCSVFSEGRTILKDSTLQGKNRFKQVYDLINKKNHGKLGVHSKDLENLSGIPDDSFLLFRKRGEALEASSRLQLHPHRVRMSGLPRMLPDWIARLFWDWTERDMDLKSFQERWEERIGSDSDPLPEWRTLIRIVGRTETLVDVRKLSEILSRGTPPPELSLPDFGSKGPLIGTIHGAKGREACQVRLYLPGVPKDEDGTTDWDEEARVLFVGASRAKEYLLVGKFVSGSFTTTLKPRGRAYSVPFRGKGSPRVEIGRQGDIDASGLVGKSLFRSCEAATACQKRLIELGIEGSIIYMQGTFRSGRYEVCPTEGCNRTPLFFLSTQVNQNLISISSQAASRNKTRPCLRPPEKLFHLRLFGTTTLALSPDDRKRDNLLSPWKESGFMIAPLVLGYVEAYFRR